MEAEVLIDRSPGEVLAALHTLLKCVHLSGQDKLCVLGAF